MENNIKQQHREYIEKYKKGYTYSAYKQKRDEWLCDADIHSFYLLKCTNDIKQFRHNIEEQVRREFFTDTEEWFDADDLEYIKQNQYVH